MIEHTRSTASPGIASAAVLKPTDRPQTDAIASAHVGTTKRDRAILEAQAKAALVGLGWKSAIARGAIAATLAESGHDLPLERLIFESLRRCPMRKA